ncbi:1-deoxy-D-xylulose-5-phosphate synthase N-terminal domain-containing protein, partial [Campylobacter coli]
MDLSILQEQANTLRFLSADMVQKANSGHPGAPLGMADILTVLSYHLSHNPKNPTWLNRDRLVFSGGHASALLYSFLHLSGYDLSLDDIKNFRQLHSKTPGHPEISTQGVEIATGPLGQGIANAVGFAMAAKKAQNLLGKELINHKVYCLCGDGDLQEGISYEACSLAGLHKLDNLIIIYDSNEISIEGDVSLAFNEDVKMRFESQGFEVLSIDGHDYEAIDKALKQAKEANKPCLIIAKTT